MYYTSLMQMICINFLEVSDYVELIIDGLMDTLHMIPFLAVTFFAIELLEHKLGKKFDSKIKDSKKLGPLIGSLLGVVPQCGFSVIGVAFFSQGLISIGTLIAIFISTSDEALPILISTPGAASKILPFIITKLIFAISIGYIIDLIFSKKRFSMDYISEEQTETCCNDDCISKPFKLSSTIYHTLERTFKIALYVAVITIAINFLFKYMNFSNIVKHQYSNQLVQVLVASAIGLIPNCAVSVGMAELYLHNAISYAALISGLASNAGLALIVLYKETKDKKKALNITLLLYVSAVISGIILMLLNIKY